MATCVTNIDQSVSDYNGTDGLKWFSATGPDLSGLPLWSEHAETRLSPTEHAGTGSCRILPEPRGQKAPQIRRRNQKPLFFAAVQQNRTITIENATKLWVEQAWLCDTGAELMNVEGFCRERMQSKVRQPKAKAALVNVVVMRPKDRPQHHS